jgi:hypothetical protein
MGHAEGAVQLERADPRTSSVTPILVHGTARHVKTPLRSTFAQSDDEIQILCQSTSRLRQLATV